MSQSIKRLLLLLAILCGLPIMADAQIANQGGETTVSYTPPTAVLTTSTPALQLSLGTGVNTFLMNVNPTVSARVYLTNETANACNGAFTVSIAVTSAGQTTSFNNQLNQWQSVALLSSTGQLVNSVGVNIPASGTAYVSSTAISGTRIAVQVVNTTSGCATSTIDAVVILTSVSVTSPLISNVNGSFSGGSLADVQGTLPTGNNGNPIFPIVNGAIEPTINGGFFNLGIDNFSVTNTSFPSGLSGNFTIGTPPPPSKTTDWGLLFYTGISGSGGTGLQAPWVCVPALVGSCGASAGGGSVPIAQIVNISQTNAPVVSITNSVAFAQTYVHFIEFNSAPSSIRQATNFGSASATLAGSTLLVSVFCQNAPCIINSVTDSQGNTWKPVITSSATAGQMGGLSEWIAGPSSAAAETITITPNAGTTVSGAAFLEMVGMTPANPNQPIVPLFASNRTFTANENDNGGMFLENGGFSYTQTLSLSGAATSNVNLWNQLQHGVFNSCHYEQRVTAMAGTTPTLNTYLQDGPDLVGWADRLSMLQVTASPNSQIGAVTGGAGITPAATTDGTLAAGSKVDGPLGQFGRLKFVLGGTTPTATVIATVTCR